MIARGKPTSPERERRLIAPPSLTLRAGDCRAFVVKGPFMSTIKLSDYECDQDLLPPVCMFCGQPATTRVRRNFTWYPGWVIVLILVNLIVMLVVALVLTKKLTVRVPTCDQHEGYWRRRSIIVSLSGVVVVGACIAALVYVMSLPPGGNDLSGWVCGSSVVLLLLWL